MNRQQKALVFIKSDRLSLKEIAEHVGLPYNTVKWLKSMVKTKRMTWDGQRVDRLNPEERTTNPGQTMTEGSGKPEQTTEGQEERERHPTQPDPNPGEAQHKPQETESSQGQEEDKPTKKEQQDAQEQAEKKARSNDYQHLIGMKKYVNQIDFLMQHGTKACLIGGHPGLGKSTLVTTLAEDRKAKLIRIQVTEMTTDFDIIGCVDGQGDWNKSDFVDSLIEASQNPKQQYVMLLDEFTRGQNECLGVLMPVLAEKKLIINNTRSTTKQIMIPSNVKIFATGNLQDINQRQISGAELDRYNIVTIEPIRDNETITRLIHTIEGVSTKDTELLTKAYMASWQMADEERIKPMSHRTLLEATRLLVKHKNKDRKKAFKEIMRMTYYCTSAATLDPQCAQTYTEIIEEAL